MTDTEIIKAIAEFHGVRHEPRQLKNYRGDEVEERYPFVWKDSKGRTHRAGSPPPYLTSLDAIVPVCEKLDEKQRDNFVRWLYVFSDHPMPYESMDLNRQCTVVNATARQRCEALLRTIGKWRKE